MNPREDFQGLQRLPLRDEHMIVVECGNYVAANSRAAAHRAAHVRVQPRLG